jgi:hypothetical protein
MQYSQLYSINMIFFIFGYTLCFVYVKKCVIHTCILNRMQVSVHNAYKEVLNIKGIVSTILQCCLYYNAVYTTQLIVMIIQYMQI